MDLWRYLELDLEVDLDDDLDLDLDWSLKCLLDFLCTLTDFLAPYSSVFLEL